MITERLLSEVDHIGYDAYVYIAWLGGWLLEEASSMMNDACVWLNDGLIGFDAYCLFLASSSAAPATTLTINK